MTMHRCLQIPEIILIIVDILQRHRQALLSFSQTCKFFLEPSLDVIWRNMDSATPIVNLIAPPDKRPQNEDASKSTYHDVMSLLRVIERADWKRVNYYASRVKQMTVQLEEIDDLLLRTLPLRVPAHAMPLLPNLRRLRWSDDMVESLPCLKMFCGPKLEHMGLTISPWPKECDGFLASAFSDMRDSCPLLHTLDICHEYDHDWSGSGRQLTLIVTAFPAIRHTSFYPRPSGDTLMALSTMPNLRTLHAIFDPGSPFVWDTRFPLEFPALRDLYWPVFDFDEITDLLRGLKSTNRRELKAVEIECDNGEFETTKLVTFVDAFRVTCSFQALTSLSIHSIDSPTTRRPPTKTVLASSLLRPLLEFSGIEVLSIRWLPIEWDNKFLDELSAAWRSLRVLDLRARYASETSITQAGMRSIARCRRLADISLNLASMFDDSPSSTNQRSTICASPNTRTRSVSLSLEIVDPDPDEVDDHIAAGKLAMCNIFPRANIQYRIEIAYSDSDSSPSSSLSD